MTWTLIMLSIAFGLAISGFLGWWQERRTQTMRNREPRAAAGPEAEIGASRMARRDHPANPRQIGAGAR